MNKVEIENEDKIEELLELVHTKELIKKVKEDCMDLNDEETIYA